MLRREVSQVESRDAWQVFDRRCPVFAQADDDGRQPARFRVSCGVACAGRLQLLFALLELDSREFWNDCNNDAAVLISTRHWHLIMTS